MADNAQKICLDFIFIPDLGLASFDRHLKKHWQAKATVMILSMAIGCFSSLSHAQTPINKEIDSRPEKAVSKASPQPVNVSAIIEATGFPFPGHKAVLDLKILDCTTKYQVNAELVNNTAQPIVFESIKAACNCTQIKISDKFLVADGATLIQLNFNTPKSVASTNFSTTFDLLDDQHRQVLTVVIRFELRGNLAISKSFGNVLELQGKLGSWSFPIVFTEPVDFKNLTIEKSPGFSDVETTLRRDEKGHFLQLTCASLFVKDNGTAGWVIVKDSALGIESHLDLLIVRRPPISVSPALLMFSSDSEFPDKYSTSVLVKLEPDEIGLVGNLTLVEANFGTKPLNVTSRTIGKGIYRLKLVAVLAESDPDTGTLNWRFHTESGLTHETTTTFSWRKK